MHDENARMPSVCHSLLCRVLAAFAVLVLVAGCSTTTAIDTVIPPPPGPPTKYSALVVDAATSETLYQVNATAVRYPASLTKMMTLYLTFEALDQGRISKSTLIPVSRFAARQAPSRIGLKAGQTIDVDSAILALTVKSGNDAAVALAEYLGGSEDGFAQTMTARARQLGMTGTTFRNASGLPDPEQRTTARDMAVLGKALRARFPQHYHYFSVRDFTYNGRLVRGHNDLLGRVEGVDGIKTGYIRASGYNIVTSVNSGGRRLIVVVMGADSARARNAQVEALIAQYRREPTRNAGSLLGSLFAKN